MMMSLLAVARQPSDFRLILDPGAAHVVGAGLRDAAGTSDYNVERRAGPTLQTSSFLSSLFLSFIDLNFF
jgi:hypothetical protein